MNEIERKCLRWLVTVAIHLLWGEYNLMNEGARLLKQLDTPSSPVTSDQKDAEIHALRVQTSTPTTGTCE
jgi:hypothetical protein